MRTDAGAVRLGATPIEVRPGGYKVYRGVATYGDVVLEYPEDGWNEFVPASTALDPETVRLTEGVPLTVLHPDEMLDASDEDALREHTEGMVLRALADMKARPPEMRVDVIVYTASAQEAIESGRIRELSLGYDRQAEDRAGTHLGKPYQKVQTRRRPNHLSAVVAARSTTPDGRRARLDSAVAVSTVRMDRDIPAGQVEHTLTIKFAADGLSWARVDDGRGMTVSPAPAEWADSLAIARRLLVPADDLGQLPPVSDQAPTRAAYAHPGDKMPDDLTTTPDATRSDADVVVEEPAADPAAALVAAFSPEAVEILKTLPEEDMAALTRLLALKQGEEAEEAVVAAAEGGAPPVEVEEVDDGTMPAASQALTMDAVQKMIADALMAAGMGKKTDAAPPAVAPAPAKPEPRVDAADVARRAAAIVDADQAFVGKVRRAGHRCDSVKDARSAALAVIKTNTPAAYAVAERALKDGRRDDFVALFDAAEDARRDGLLEDQLAVLDAAQRGIAADRLGHPAAFPSITAPARAVTGD